ncbi:MAG: DUF4870 domain-containing protein [Actinomycetota bacterium]|nr:DUF4870 domain-containing protein [Actinomycetota bacterium]
MSYPPSPEQPSQPPDQGHPPPNQGYPAPPNQGHPQPNPGYPAPHTGYLPPNQGHLGTSAPADDDKTWALAAHIGVLVAAWFAMGFIAPLVILLIKGGSSPFVKRHATESLNFQLSLLLYSLIAALLAVFTLGLGLFVIIPVALVIMLLALVAIIMGTVAASKGDDFRYPLCIRFLS